MYKAYFGNSLEKMIEDYSSIFIPSDILDKDSVFIIQNRNMEEWLKLKLAEKTGVFAGLNFQFQDETLRNIISLSPEIALVLETKKTIYLDDLKLIVFHTLKNIFDNIEKYSEFSSLKSYVNHEYPLSEGEMNNIKSSRLYRLSDSIAGLFHHYGLNSSEMIKAWANNRSYASGTEYDYLQTNEKWQMRLWDIIFGLDSSYLHPGQIIERILEGEYSLPQDINKKIIIFGSSFLSEQAVEFFHHLSLKCSTEIHHFILSPSPYVTRKGIEKSLLLSQWGNIVIGLSEMLIDKGIAIEESYEVPAGCDMPKRCKDPEGSILSANCRDSSEAELDEETSKTTILSSIKKAVFNNMKGCKAHAENDSSFRIISVPGKKREIEILKNNIINMIDNEGYKFYEIGVAAPDINKYVPYIDSIFRSTDPKLDIKYNLMDVGFVEDSDYLNGFFTLLDLSGSRFSRKELFRLFHNRCFMNRFHLSDSDIEKWLEICDILFIKWGYDRSHREDLIEKGSDFATWKKALDRISCGFLFNDDEGEMKFSSGDEILPYHLSGNYEEKTISRLFYIVDQLYEKIYKLRFNELEIPVWAVRMEALCDFFFSPVYGTGDDNDRKYLKNVFRQINTLVIENIEAASLSEKPVPYSLYRTLVDEFAGKSGYCRGQYLAEGISFSSLKPLRAIPFKVIFLLGMDENNFPGKERSLNYDLRTLAPKSIDLSIQNTDCFTFLETILSAEEKLFISYTGTDIITGENLEPSPLVTELAELFDKEDYDKFIKKHPLHSYNEVYFEDSCLFRDFISYDSLFYKAASVFRDQKKNNTRVLSLDTGYDLPDKVEAEAAVYELEKYLKYPVSFFLEHVEGIKRNEDSLIENDDIESFTFSYKDQNNLYSEISGSSGDESSLFSFYVKEGLLAGTLNNSSISEIESQLSENEFKSFENNLRSDGYFDSQPIEIFLSEKSNKGESSDLLLPPLKIEAGNGTLIVNGAIRGLRRRGSSWFYISFDGVKVRQLVPPFLRYLILRRITSDNDINMSVYNKEGKLIAVIGKDEYESEMILEAVAFSYIESFNTPLTADISCIAELIKNKSRIGNIDDFYSMVDEYYNYNNFNDSKFLNPGSEIRLNYKRDDFYKLFKSFYSCLDFSKKRN